MQLQELLDWHYGPDGDADLRQWLETDDSGLEEPHGPLAETPLHVAVRRRRLPAVELLLDHGAAIDARNGAGKTGYAHAIRRGFDEVATLLAKRGAETALNQADRLAVALAHGDLEQARAMLAAHPRAAHTGNPEEDRLLADMAGRNDRAPVALLIGAGADLTAPGLDGGTPLHQAAWFGQPANARLLIDAGAPLDVFEDAHQSSPLGWAVHGSRYSGGADKHQEAYAELVRMLLAAGSSLFYPEEPKSDSFRSRLLDDASPLVGEVLRAWLHKE
ncbi:MAG TPA: ankyrin repeat domain-containing protein [Planctomycetota bacterium]